MITSRKIWRKVILAYNPKFTNFCLISRSHSITYKTWYFIFHTWNMKLCLRVMRIFEFLFFKAANVGHGKKACFDIVFGKHTCMEQELCFSIFECPFKEYRTLLSAAFYGIVHNHFSASCYFLSKYQFVFPSDALPDWLAYLLWIRAVVPLHSHEVLCCFFFFFLSVRTS